jgi:hypothetical protein
VSDDRRVKGVLIGDSLLGLSRGARCRIDECRAGCCRNGINMELAHAERIRAHAADIAPHLPPERRDPAGWFDEEVEDPDFPGGRGVGTSAVDDPDDPALTACVFLRRDYRCALQVASEAIGLAYPGLKPFHCALYPILLSEGELVLDEWSPAELSGADCQREAAPRVPVADVFRDEIALALGEDGYLAIKKLLG